MYDRTTVHGATFNMRGQLYRGHTNATALSSGQCTGPGQGVVPLRRAGKKMRAPPLGLAKSIYYLLLNLILRFFTVLMLGLKRVLILIFILFQR